MRAALGRIALVVLGVSAGLIGVEAVLRLAASRSENFFAHHPIYGWFHIPGREGWFASREFRTRVTINSKGLHDREFSYQKEAGVFRILVLGDSMMDAMQVNGRDSFSKVLERLLEQDSRGRFEVINAGVNAWGTANELLFFRHEGYKYQPDLVLLAFCTCNDIANNSDELSHDLGFSGPVPVFRLAADGLRLEYGLQPSFRDNPVASRLEPIKGALRRLYVYDKIREAVVGFPSVARLLVRTGVMRDYQSGLRGELYGHYSRTYTREWEEAWAVTRALIAEIDLEVARRGARLVVVILTNPEQVHGEIWNEIVDRFTLPEGDMDLDRPDQLLATFLAEEGIPYMRLLPRFRAQARAAGEYLHFRHDGHWTARGHRFAAETVYGSLTGTKLVPGR